METSAPVVFASGAYRNTLLRKITTAMGEGSIEAFLAGQYIDNLKK